MAFKEKVAWITVISMLIAYGVYFPIAFGGAVNGVALLALFGVITVAQVVAIAIAAAIIAVQSPREANAPGDERDRAIARRGAAIAYFVLLVGMILVGVVMPFSDTGWAITNAALAALVVAEITRYAIVIASYRRGWHG